MYASEDIWEPDEEFETAVCRTSRRTVPISPLRPAQITQEEIDSFYPPGFVQFPVQPVGPLSLQTLSLSMLALYLDQYLMQMDPVVLTFLPLEAKMMLMTITR